jgi:hypothetical protein
VFLLKEGLARWTSSLNSATGCKYFKGRTKLEEPCRESGLRSEIAPSGKTIGVFNQASGESRESGIIW